MKKKTSLWRCFTTVSISPLIMVQFEKFKNSLVSGNKPVPQDGLYPSFAQPKAFSSVSGGRALFGTLDRQTAILITSHCAPSGWWLHITYMTNCHVHHLISTKLHCAPAKWMLVQNYIVNVDLYVPCEPPKCYTLCPDPCAPPEYVHCEPMYGAPQSGQSDHCLSLWPTK